MTTPPLEAQALAGALQGQYEILREVGRGGMGIVYLARDLKLDRSIAIKTLPAQLASDEVIRARFLREARTAAGLSHPNIVPVHRADEIDGHVFFVMGYVDGAPLSQLVREGGPLSPRTAIAILHDVAQALGYAHATGVVHRDIKAENILIERDTGRALVTDFGIARLAEAAPLTATGTVLGTVHYMSPEQVAGDEVDRRSDIYSLGIVAFYALSGRFPFESPTASAVLVAHVTRQAPSLASVAPTVPQTLVRLVDRCLAKDPVSRFQSCVEFIEELERVESRLPTDDVAAPRPDAGPGSISSAEAEEVWRRAAELQNLTGPMPPIRHAEQRPPTPSRNEAATAGYQLGQVRDAAREAGIGTEFVDRALVERGLAAADGESAGGPVIRDGIMPPHNPWLGGRSTIAFEAIIPGEMPERDFDLLIDIIRRALNDPGNVSGVGRSLTWTSTERARKVAVAVLVRDGRTTIHVSERLKELAGGLFGGIMGGGGGGTLGPLIGVSIEALGNPWLIPVFASMTIGATYGIARTIFRRMSRSRRAVLEEMTQRLSEQVRESVARRTVAPHRGDRKLLR
ncbi:MAG TPA: serine/threonine-protein kinase [Gemmatimonadaceae bacterium]|nr:serine/threonine-protein kinase [Gemmatimonadaceae bacterium]